jgi:hypothetical protein
MRQLVFGRDHVGSKHFTCGVEPAPVANVKLPVDEAAAATSPQEYAKARMSKGRFPIADKLMDSLTLTCSIALLM